MVHLYVVGCFISDPDIGMDEFNFEKKVLGYQGPGSARLEEFVHAACWSKMKSKCCIPLIWTFCRWVLVWLKYSRRP